MTIATATATLDPMIARLALSYVAADRAAYVAWLEDCESDRREGYRPHYCRHGVNQWTDYDAICMGCEDEGYYFSFPTSARAALDRATVQVERYHAAYRHLTALKAVLPEADLFPLYVQLGEKFGMR